MWWPKTERQQRVVALAAQLAETFAERSPQHDRDGTFPYENFADLHQHGFLALTIPEEFGGGGATILEATLAQERLARGDGSTALGTAMHLSIMGRLGRAVLASDPTEASGWDRVRYAAVAEAVVERGALINSAASEPETGSPSRGGRPATKAVPDGKGGYVLTGRKTFTTMAPALQFILVSATIYPSGSPREDAAPDESDDAEAGQFLLQSGVSGLRIEETWDSVGMRATGSHDLVLDGIHVAGSSLLARRPYKKADGSHGRAPDGLPAPAEPSATPLAVGGSSFTLVPSEGAGWAALIPAVYLGIAAAARDTAVAHARDRRPQPLGGKSIGELPNIQRLLGEIEVALAQSRGLLFGVAEAWDEVPQQRAALVPLLAAAKYAVTNNAVEIADKAMRVVGGAGLSLTHPVQRYYRDVRAGLHHPPMDDVALTTLARAALASGT